MATRIEFTKRETVPCIVDNETFNVCSKTYALNDPHSGQLLYEVDCVGKDEGILAVNSAAKAFPGEVPTLALTTGVSANGAGLGLAWSKYSTLGKREIFEKAASILRIRRDEFIKISTSETTSTEQYAKFDHFLTVSNFLETAAVVTSLKGEIAISEHGQRGYIERVPYGVVFGIAPWNCPLYLGSRSFVNAVMAGNTVVMKTSEFAPKVHTFLAEIFREAGLPPGVLNVIHIAPEDSPAVCEAIIAHRAVGKLNFTGSSAVGAKLGELCGRYIKPACMELGGKAPFIVLEDADVQAAAQCAAFGGFVNSGQICMSTDSIIVHENVADAFIRYLNQHLQGAQAAPDSKTYRGVFCQKSATRIDGMLQEALSGGAKVVAGQHHVSGSVVQPVAVEGITDLMREEIFGPAVTIRRFKTDQDALNLANATDYGLAAAIYGADESKCLEMAQSLHAGMIHINGPTVHDVQLFPHGGVGKSGYGRFNGLEGLREFTQTRVITINPIHNVDLP